MSLNLYQPNKETFVLLTPNLTATQLQAIAHADGKPREDTRGWLTIDCRVLLARNKQFLVTAVRYV